MTTRVGERGSVSVTAAAVMSVVVGCALGLSAVHGAMSDASRAALAADAAALAGVSRGRAGAEAVARANGATLMEYREVGVAVEVRVRAGRAEATAAAAPASIH